MEGREGEQLNRSGGTILLADDSATVRASERPWTSEEAGTSCAAAADAHSVGPSASAITTSERRMRTS